MTMEIKNIENISGDELRDVDWKKLNVSHNGSHCEQHLLFEEDSYDLSVNMLNSAHGDFLTIVIGNYAPPARKSLRVASKQFAGHEIPSSITHYALHDGDGDGDKDVLMKLANGMIKMIELEGTD